MNDSVDPNATNPSGNAVLSGRLVHSSYHADGKMWFSFNGDPYQDSWYGFPKSFYLENLVLDQNYTLSAFIDLNENYDPGDHDNTFEEGEPFDELNITLNADTYGLKLIPVDSAPVLEFYDPADSDETVSYEDSFSKVVIDVNGTEQTTSFA